MMKNTEKNKVCLALSAIDVTKEDITEELTTAIQLVSGQRNRQYLAECIEDMDETFKLLRFNSIQDMNNSKITTLKEMMDEL